MQGKHAVTEGNTCSNDNAYYTLTSSTTYEVQQWSWSTGNYC